MVVLCILRVKENSCKMALRQAELPRPEIAATCVARPRAAVHGRRQRLSCHNILDAKGVIDVSWAMLTRPITVAETQLFVRQADDVWSEEERFEFVDFIAINPEAGDVISETGGVRKIRWTRRGSGKRGGVRVIYFYHDEEAPLYLLMVYAKGEKEDLRPDEKRAVAKLTATLKAVHRSGRT
jgi:mRNA-degrading endonuclease RelE of RelBE toxin-antitoxin system